MHFSIVHVRDWKRGTAFYSTIGKEYDHAVLSKTRFSCLRYDFTLASQWSELNNDMGCSSLYCPVHYWDVGSASSNVVPTFWKFGIKLSINWITAKKQRLLTSCLSVGEPIKILISFCKCSRHLSIKWRRRSLIMICNNDSLTITLSQAFEDDIY